MIDFRWLEIDAVSLDRHPSALAWGDTGRFRVLQIREAGEQRWGDWHDIPIVIAPTVTR